MFDEIAAIVLQLLPLILPKPLADQIATEIHKAVETKKKEWAEDEQKLLQAIQNNDFDAINRLLAKLLRGVQNG